jgi:hypothetical protein
VASKSVRLWGIPIHLRAQHSTAQHSTVKSNQCAKCAYTAAGIFSGVAFVRNSCARLAYRIQFGRSQVSLMNRKVAHGDSPQREVKRGDPISVGNPHRITRSKSLQTRLKITPKSGIFKFVAPPPAGLRGDIPRAPPWQRGGLGGEGEGGRGPTNGQADPWNEACRGGRRSYGYLKESVTVQPSLAAFRGPSGRVFECCYFGCGCRVAI